MRKNYKPENSLVQIASKSGIFIEICKKRRRVVLSLFESGITMKWFQRIKEITKTKQHRLCVEMTDEEVEKLISTLSLLVKSHDDCH